MTNIRVRHFHKNSNLVAAFIPKSGMNLISFYRLGVIVNRMVCIIMFLGISWSFLGLLNFWAKQTYFGNLLKPNNQLCLIGDVFYFPGHSSETYGNLIGGPLCWTKWSKYSLQFGLVLWNLRSSIEKADSHYIDYEKSSGIISITNPNRNPLLRSFKILIKIS